MKPKGPFNLLFQNKYFNSWPVLATDPKTVVMCFPVEGWTSSATVTLRQEANSTLTIQVYGTSSIEKAQSQALAAMSLDEDDSGWPDVGKRDSFIEQLQQKYQYMRPTLFHSPYEAAAAFIIGHRITISQTRKIRAEMAQDLGEVIVVGEQTFAAFPTPQVLLGLTDFRGLNEQKIHRLHAVAQAALDGLLDRTYLRSVPDETALQELEKIPGIGPFFSQGILYRGAGQRDGFSHDDMTYYAIQIAYGLNTEITKEEILAIAERWHPYRMWTTVLLHVWLRENNDFPKRTFSKR
jgi:3-methyladenine DNA glycosylase/8-oxoguanine DNA glycosylase